MSLKLEHILDTYAFNAQQKNQLRIADTKKLDLDYLANPLLDWEQMREIIICMEFGIDPTPLCNPNIPSEDLEKLREHLFKLNGVWEQAQEDISRKRTKRIVFTITAAIILSAIIGLVYANREYIGYYLEDLELELKTDRIEISTNDAFVASEYIKKYDKDLELKLPTLKSDIPGEYNLTYTISNSVKSVSKHLIVIVQDTTSPTIELKQHSLEITADTNVDFKDYISKANDNVDGDVKEKVEISNIPDTSKAGRYTVTYSVKDAAGNTGQATLFVTIVSKPIKEPEMPSNSGTYASGNANTPSVSVPVPEKPSTPTKIIVSAAEKKFYNANPLVAKEEAVAYAKSMLAAKKANGYDCNPIYDQTTNLAIGYVVTFY